MTKQTAIEWLAQEMDYLIPSDKELLILQIVNQAKKIEKQQIKDAYLRGIENYDPTFKNKNNED